MVTAIVVGNAGVITTGDEFVETILPRLRQAVCHLADLGVRRIIIDMAEVQDFRRGGRRCVDLGLPGGSEARCRAVPQPARSARAAAWLDVPLRLYSLCGFGGVSWNRALGAAQHSRDTPGAPI